MTARVLELAILYGVVFALVVGVAERAAGSPGRIAAIVAGIALFGPYVWWILGRSRGSPSHRRSGPPYCGYRRSGVTRREGENEPDRMESRCSLEFPVRRADAPVA